MCSARALSVDLAGAAAAKKAPFTRGGLKAAEWEWAIDSEVVVRNRCNAGKCAAVSFAASCAMAVHYIA